MVSGSSDRAGPGTQRDPESRLRRLVHAITRAQEQIFGAAAQADLFPDLLATLLELTESEHGLIGEAHCDSKKEGQPAVEAHALAQLTRDAVTGRPSPERAPADLVLPNRQTLLGAVLVTGEPLIVNDPDKDGRASGLAPGHPPLTAFLGLPLFRGDELIGVIGVANRPGGYAEDLVAFLQPLLVTCAGCLSFLRAERFRDSAQAALWESEARTRAIVESTVDAILTIDERGIIVSANPATERLFGYRTDEMVGRNVSLLMPSPHRVQHDRYLRSYLETGVAKVIGIGREVSGLRKDGSTFPMYLAVGEVHGSGRRRFTGIAHDITARKVALTRLEAALQDLQRSNDALLATLNQLQIGTVMLDRDGCISFLSDPCGCLEGVDALAAVGRRWEEVLPVARTFRDAILDMLCRAEGSRTRLHFHWQPPSGRQRWVEVDVRDDPRDPTARIVYLYDVSEVNELRFRLARSTYGQLTGTSAAMREVYEQIAQLAGGDWTVLIQGETGVGKELVARAIHAASPRKQGPFIAVNCAGLTDTLLESQLFGHRRGAFTGAVADQQGLFEAAAGGTILLDEIGDISTKVQTSLLRVLQEREVLRIGESKVRKVDVRILAATNRDLAQEVTAGRFRADLLYRIRVARLVVPPLRNRTADIPLLVSSFLFEQRLSTGRPVTEIDNAALSALVAYPWPGNVRELKSAIEHAVIRCKGLAIRLEDLPPELRGDGEPVLPVAPAQAAPLPAAPLPEQRPGTAATRDERARILEALDWAEGNRARAARRLGLSRATLYRRLRDLGIPIKKG